MRLFKPLLTIRSSSMNVLRSLSAQLTMLPDPILMVVPPKPTLPQKHQHLVQVHRLVPINSLITLLLPLLHLFLLLLHLRPQCTNNHSYHNQEYAHLLNLMPNHKLLLKVVPAPLPQLVLPLPLQDAQGSMRVPPALTQALLTNLQYQFLV